jgi:DENN (AEX-3) domain/ENTH domain
MDSFCFTYIFFFFSSSYRSVEAISSQQAALAKELRPREEPQKWFLIALSRYQQHLAAVYVTLPAAERGKPLIAALEGVELGINPKYKAVDVSRFIVPTSLLHRPPLVDPSATNSSSSILPLLRCVGVAHALRITAALLSERRVVMMSHSPARLCNCSHAAMAILAQGMLHWQHLYIPVLPPHLWPYLAAPYPYLIGILASAAPKLDRTDGLGEVLIINLDVNTMETRGMDQETISQRLPDLFQQAVQSANNATSSVAAGSGVPAVQAAASPSEFLAQDLTEILRSDKRMLQGESNLANLGMETAAKATQAVKNTFFKLRDKGKQYLQNRSGSGFGERESTTPPPGDESFSDPDVKSLAADYVFTEGCRNEACEEDARVAFATFFLCMFGNMKWYLTPVGQGQVPQLDRNRFLQQKRAMGDGEGTPMWTLLQNFCQTQMLEEFVKARVEEIRLRQPVTPDAPLFVQCTNFHRQQNIDFGLLSVRQVCQQVAQTNPSRVSQLQISARRNAMTLTSNKNFEGDYGKAIAALIEQCRECTAVLLDVMSVIWLRIRDAKGLQWKHAYQSLQLLRNLLLHGPIGAVAEATDGLDKIRALKYYENMRAQAAHQVRSAADFVYILLIDRAKLFSIRRFCAQRRRDIRESKPEVRSVLVFSGCACESAPISRSVYSYSLLEIAAWTSTRRFGSCTPLQARLRPQALLSEFPPMLHDRVQWIEECRRVSRRTYWGFRHLRLRLHLRLLPLLFSLPILSARQQELSLLSIRCKCHPTTFWACSIVCQLPRGTKLPSHRRHSMTLLQWHPNPLRSHSLLRFQ